MAQVTCNLVEPKQSRPNEGVLLINMEFNHVACPGYEPGRLSRKGTCFQTFKAIPRGH